MKYLILNLNLILSFSERSKNWREESGISEYQNR